MSNQEFDYSQVRKPKQSTLRRKFDTGMTAFIVVAACILFYFLLLRLPTIWGIVKRIVTILAPVWFGCAFAFLMNPVMKWVEKHMAVMLADSSMDPDKQKKLARGIGILGSLIVLLAIVVILFNMMIPELYKSIRHLVLIMPSQLNQIVKQIENIDATSSIGSMLIELAENGFEYLKSWLRGDLWDSVNLMMGSVTSGIISAARVLINILIGLIIAVYVLMSKENFSAGVTRIIYAYISKERANFLMHIGTKCNEVFGGFVIGKIIDSLIMGILCFIGLSILKLTASYTLLISVIVGVTNIIPFFGPFIGAVPCAFLILLEEPLHALYFVLFILVLQQLDGNVIGPKILGSSTGLSAFWVVVAILIGSGLFGFLGMLLGVPAFAVIYYLFDMIIEDRLKRRGLSTRREDYVYVRSINDEMKMVYDERTEEEKKQDRDRRWPILAKIRLLLAGGEQPAAEVEEQKSEKKDSQTENNEK